jgi:hypothetical protein
MANMTQFVVKGHPYDYKWLTPDMIKVDVLFQRELDAKKVKRIVNEWNYDVFNEPKVSQRKDGSYYVFDGQHTVAAHKAHEGESAPLLCKVYRGLTWEEEKDLFLAQNGIHSDPTTAQKLRAQFNANNPTVRGMYDTCSKIGIKVIFANHGGGARYNCTAVSALYGAYMTLPEKDFVRAMSILARAWGGESLSLSAGFIKGMKKMFLQYSDKIKDSEMVKSLSKLAPEYYVREAKELGGNLETKYSTVFLRVYNKNRTTGRLTA